MEIFASTLTMTLLGVTSRYDCGWVVVFLKYSHFLSLDLWKYFHNLFVAFFDCSYLGKFGFFCISKSKIDF